ncbi:MAG: dihydrofolate reductase family protein [Solirubrobacteraceae bacterium]
MSNSRPGRTEGFAHGGWSFKFSDPEGMKYKLDEVFEHDALLLGRVTYEGFAAAWPSRTDEAGFADRMNGMPKYVVSTTLRDATWNNSTIIRGDVAAEVAALKQQPGGDILVCGSRTLAHTLRANDLVDEYRLMVHPIVLGAGKRLFDDTGAATTLKLAECRTLDSGSLILHYHPVR